MRNTLKVQMIPLAQLRRILMAFFMGTICHVVFCQQQTYTFTTASASGSLGPTQGQITSAYSLSNLNGSVTSINGIQSFTIPTTGLYSIDAFGASGGNRLGSPQRSGGFGARMKGEFNLSQGDIITILVGQKGVDGTNTGAGGGGTFVQKNGVLLIAAGAGGGATGDNGAANGTTLTTGTNDFPGGSIPGGVNGSGGLVCNSSGANHGGGGGGYTGNGATSTLNNAAGGGLAFMNGGTGGASAVPGAFGGGGGATMSGAGLYGGGGGGGGYSGGAGGQQINHCTPGIDRSGGGGGGSYNIGANQTNSVLTNSGDGKVILASLCYVSISAPVSSLCAGKSVVLTTNAVTNISWNTGATSTSIIVSPTVTTTYSVTGTSTDNCVASSQVTVVVKPLPNVTASSSPTTLCLGNTATLTASGASSYTWNSTQINNTTTANPVSTTNYTVSGTSAAGCTNSTVVTVTVNTNSLTPTSNHTICLGSTAALGVSGAVSYTWSNGSFFNPLPVTPSTTTVYTVTGRDIFNCLLTTSVSVFVNPTPTISVSMTPTNICKGETTVLEAQGATSYSWSSGQGSATIAVTPTVDVNYYFSVIGIDNNGCRSEVTTSFKVNKCTALSENTFLNVNAEVYPNPSDGKINIIVGNYSPRTQVEIYNSSGQKIYKQAVTSELTAIQLPQAAQGFYFINITEDNKVLQSKKLIVQ